MTKRRTPLTGLLLTALLSAACGGDDGKGGGGTGGQTPAAMAGGDSGGMGGGRVSSSGAGSGSAIGGSHSGGTGTAHEGGSGAGGAPAGRPSDQQVHDTSDTCLYSGVRVEIDKGGDAAVEASIDSWIKTAVYDRSSGMTFIVGTHDGEHLELSWQPPASKPGVADFRGVLKYAAQDGKQRSLCFDGRMLDAFHYPIELYYPFVAKTAFEATPDGDCTTTPVQVTVSGCVSDGYNIR